MHILQQKISVKTTQVLFKPGSDLTLTCENIFVQAFKKFSVKKNLNEFVKNQEYFFEPIKVNMGFDPKIQKKDTTQDVQFILH